MNDKNSDIPFRELIKKASNSFLINGNNNNQIIGTNIHINHYTMSDKSKIQKVVEDHQYNPAIHILPEQQQKIQEFVEDIAKMMENCGSKENYYQLIYGNLKKKFKVPKYSLLKQEQYNEVKKYLYIEKAKFRKELKKIARKRLEEGADVKTELLYIDMVRNIEKIGDRAYSISEALARTK